MSYGSSTYGSVTYGGLTVRLFINISIYDYGLSDEQLSILNKFTINDLGLSDEDIDILNRFTLSEDGNSTDTIGYILSKVLVTDTGTHDEYINTIIKLLTVLIQDSGNIDDTILTNVTKKLLHVLDISKFDSIGVSLDLKKQEVSLDTDKGIVVSIETKNKPDTDIINDDTLNIKIQRYGKK